MRVTLTPPRPCREALELRVAEIERLVVSRLMMRGPERLRFGPRFEHGPVFPDRVRSIKRMILGFGTFEKMKLHKAGHLVEMTVARNPDVLKIGFGALGDAETVHGDKHKVI